MLKSMLMNIYLNSFSVDLPNFEDSVPENIQNDQLQSMYDEIESSPKIYHPSVLWQKLSKIHEKRLEKFGVNNFKRTIVTDYSHFPPFPDKSFRKIFSLWIKKPTRKILKNLKVNLGILHYSGHFLSLNGMLGIYYSFYLRMFYELIKDIDTLNILSKCEEPQFGNPIKILYDGIHITYDQCSSVMEYYEIMTPLPLEIKNKKLIIGELGAGYGKLAYIFLRSNSTEKYLIFDIPPTLYLAQTYLSKIFPEKKIMKFRHFENFDDIKNDFEQSEICFFTPNQLSLIPNDAIDLFINISSLHEMRPDQIENFHNLINSVTKNYFFSKQYPGTMELPKNLSGAYEIALDDYPIPENWKIVFKDYSKINPRFVNLLFKI